jgi:hypothetical protein
VFVPFTIRLKYNELLLLEKIKICFGSIILEVIFELCYVSWGGKAGKAGRAGTHGACLGVRTILAICPQSS